MLKRLALLLVVCSTAAFAETSLQVPLLDTYTKELLSTHNKALKKAGFEQFPEWIVVTSAEEARSQVLAFDQLADTAFEQLDRKITMLAYSTPDEYANKSRNRVLCYNGEPQKSVELLASLTDSVLTPYVQILGWKYKTEVSLNASVQAKPEKFPRVWHTWKGRTESILLISTESDAPETRIATVVPKCAKPRARAH